MAIRNIIFDLGGIFIDIHYHKTRDAFIAAGITDFDNYFQQAYSNPLFAQLETGTILPQDFYDGLRLQTGLSMSNPTIEQAWNAMLGDFRPNSIAILPELRRQYRIYLLSNTNQIHWEAFTNSYTTTTNGLIFDDYFHHAHYSHQLGLRKPDVECYEAVLQQHQLVADETLFVDDTPKNLAGAVAAGLQILHLPQGQWLEQLLPTVL